jgi:hypothetical protein
LSKEKRSDLPQTQLVFPAIFEVEKTKNSRMPKSRLQEFEKILVKKVYVVGFQPTTTK